MIIEKDGQIIVTELRPMSEVKTLITQQELKRLVDYDPLTGIFRWKLKTGRGIKVGKVAGSIRKKTKNNQSYVRVSIKKVVYLAHRLAWLYMYGEYPKGQIDHIDGIGYNNQILNLRDVSHQENGRNQKLPDRNKSGVCGVYWNKLKRKWQAEIIFDKKKIFLGLFKDLNKAAEARKKAEINYGFHVNHGKPREIFPTSG